MGLTKQKAIKECFYKAENARRTVVDKAMNFVNAFTALLKKHEAAATFATTALAVIRNAVMVLFIVSQTPPPTTAYLPRRKVTQ